MQMNNFKSEPIPLHEDENTAIINEWNKEKETCYGALLCVSQCCVVPILVVLYCGGILTLSGAILCVVLLVGNIPFALIECATSKCSSIDVATMCLLLIFAIIFLIICMVAIGTCCTKLNRMRKKYLAAKIAQRNIEGYKLPTQI